MEKYDAGIIGGGLAGLIAAVELARAGKKVALFEKSSRLGGRAMTIRKGGAWFDLGAHALYRGGEAETALTGLGVRLAGSRPSTKGASVLWNGKAVNLPELLVSGPLSWSGKAELVRLLVKLGKLDTMRLASVSLREWAERTVRDPAVRHFLYAQCRTSTYTLDPDYQEAGPALGQMLRGLKTGVLYIDHGWQSMIDQLRALAAEAGAVMESGRAVEAIEHEGGRVRRLRFAGGETSEADFIVSTAPPHETFRLVRGAERTSLAVWKEQARPQMAACLALYLRRQPVPGRNFVLGVDRPVFYTQQSAAAKLSDQDGAIMHVLKYNGTAGGDPTADEAMLEGTMDLIQPGWRNEVMERQYLPNMAVVHDYAHIGRRDRFPGPAVPEIRGLCVAGDWASHGEVLADAAAASAKRAVKHILGELERELPAAKAN